MKRNLSRICFGIPHFKKVYLRGSGCLSLAAIDAQFSQEYNGTALFVLKCIGGYSKMDYTGISEQVHSALKELFSIASPKQGELIVVGCSTSAVAGFDIGSQSDEHIASALMDAILPEIKANGLMLAVQCCEHLNRALVVERQAYMQYGLTQVWVKPWLHAGGAFAACAIERFEAPVVVEDIRACAAAGLDIGDTFIGMHLRPVVVPLHTRDRKIGEANLTMAYTRPKYIGGPRAQYEQLNGY